jgi:hypothetical protein
MRFRYGGTTEAMRFRYVRSVATEGRGITEAMRFRYVRGAEDQAFLPPPSLTMRS